MGQAALCVSKSDTEDIYSSNEPCDITLPTAIQSIVLVDARSTSLIISWPPVENATRYVLAYQQIPDFQDLGLSAVTATTSTEVVSGSSSLEDGIPATATAGTAGGEAGTTPGFEILTRNLTQTYAVKTKLSPSTSYRFRVAAAFDNLSLPLPQSSPSDVLPIPEPGPWTTHDEPFTTLSVFSEQRSMIAPIVVRSGLHRSLYISWDPLSPTKDEMRNDENVTTKLRRKKSLGYQLQMREERGGARWTTVARSIRGTEVRKTGLDTSTAYRFRVRRNLDDEEEEGMTEGSHPGNSSSISSGAKGWRHADNTIPYSPPSDPPVVPLGLSPGIARVFHTLDYQIQFSGPALFQNVITTTNTNISIPQSLPTTGFSSPQLPPQLTPIPIADAIGGSEFVLLYIAADWCPPCQQYTPFLASWYQQTIVAASTNTTPDSVITNDTDRVIIVFLSCDQTEPSFRRSIASHHPGWLTVGYNDSGREQLMEEVMEGMGGEKDSLPRLVVVSGRTGRVLDGNAVGKELNLDHWRELDT